MLQVATRLVDEEEDMADAIPVHRPSSASAWIAGESRYGQRSRPNLPLVAAIVCVHVLLIVALIQVRTHIMRAQEEKLTVVNLSSPPPPAAETPPPPPSAPQVVAPPPIVQTPVPPVPSVQTSPEPSRVMSAAPPAPPSPVPAASPVAVAAPPSIVQAGDLGTQMVSGKPPRYPIESRRKKEQGTVVLSLVLGLDGAVESISIAQSSGSRRLDDAARDAVKGWRWRPTVRSGQPVRVKGLVEIPFILRSDAA